MLPKLVPVSWLRGLINVVPKVEAGNNSSMYCIGNFAMNMFTIANLPHNVLDVGFFEAAYQCENLLLKREQPSAICIDVNA